MKSKMVMVRFLKECHLPRFAMRPMELWRVRIERLQGNGFSLGGGWVTSDFYEVASKDNNYFNVGTKGHIDW